MPKSYVIIEDINRGYDLDCWNSLVHFGFRRPIYLMNDLTGHLSLSAKIKNKNMLQDDTMYIHELHLLYISISTFCTKYYQQNRLF